MHFLERLQLVLATFAILATTFTDNTFHASATELSPTLLKPVTIQARYNTRYTYYVNASAEYVFYYKSSDIGVFDGAKIYVQSEDATFDYPIIVVVRQKKGILAWQVPTLVQSRTVIDPFHYRNTSRNLCPSKYYEIMDYGGPTEYVAISIATASRQNISFHLELKPVPDFYINPGESRTFDVTPSEPVYFGYDFAKSKDDRSVLVKVSSDSQVCMTFSIENTTCPVFGYDGNTKQAGYWQTVSLQGGITVPKAAYPHGFFIVFLVNPDDRECSENSTLIYNRRKNVRLTIIHDIKKDKYILALMSIASAFIGFCIVYVVGILFYKLHRPTTPSSQMAADNTLGETDHCINSRKAQPKNGSSEGDTATTRDEVDFSTAVIINPNNITVRVTDVESQCRDIYLIDLARQEIKVLCNKSRLYLKYITTIAIFYTAPVAQLVITNQWQVHETGNEDLCYYNFQCSHPVFFLSDFNHVFSNLGYVMLGLLFMFVVYTREKYNDSFLEDQRGCGIPQHYGLYYAMGFALMMEGVLSACYHVCPNRSNFQFDTSFMYIISVLCMVKLYQNRHPDIHAEAPVTFGVLAQTILIALTGILANTTYVWAIFTIAHLMFCLFLSFRIYYMSPINVDLTLLPQKLKTKIHDVYMIMKLQSRPRYTKRLILLALGNFCNIGLAIYGNTYRAQDFGTYLLMILMLNLILYTSFYIIMKFCHKERILFQPAIYLLLAVVIWGGSIKFFVAYTTSWTATAAESRNHNQPCFPWLFYFYDSHDVWHFLSSIAMFFSFMTLLTLDDDLVAVHRSRIYVF